ncbi:MAG: hypothetical protein ACRDMZ_06775 [Solirubrobacteraceae bacterium]
MRSQVVVTSSPSRAQSGRGLDVARLAGPSSAGGDDDPGAAGRSGVPLARRTDIPADGDRGWSLLVASCRP